MACPAPSLAQVSKREAQQWVECAARFGPGARGVLFEWDAEDQAMDVQVADASTPLASVYQMCRSGNKVWICIRNGSNMCVTSLTLKLEVIPVLKWN